MLHQSRSILYVDDTVEQRYAMRRILESAGYKVVEANTGAEALKLLRPDLLAVILDVKLPDMSGYEVCRAIKETRADVDIPILQVSASFADPSMRAQALSGGADAYIAQPVHPPELLNLIQALALSYQSRKIVRFLAGVGLRISRSLDLHETLASVVRSVAPVFCDRAYISLIEENECSAKFAASNPSLQMLMAEVNTSGKIELLKLTNPACSVIAISLEAASKRLGSILFVLDESGRSYTREDIPYAEDLAARIALSIQNSQLHTVQQAAQAALVQSEKIAAAGRMSAAIAHEINNPLEAVMNMIYLIEVSPEATNEIHQLAQDALSEISRLSHITRQTLGFYREMAGPQTFNIAESIDEILVLLKRRMAS